MKSNKFDFISKFKLIMLVPIALVLLSIVIGAIFGLNLDYDFRNVSTFDVKFNTTVTSDEYKTLEKELKSIISNSDFSDYRIERIGEGAQNGLFVKIANDNNRLDEEITELKTYIEENLTTDIEDKLESSIVISTSEIIDNLPRNASNLILMSSIAIICILAFVFFYYLIRYNFISGLSLVLTILSEIVMLTTVMIVARIPFNYYFVVSYFVMSITTIIVTTLINNRLKESLHDEKYNKYSNADRVYDAVGKVFRNSSILIGIIALSVIAVMFFGNLTLLYTSLSIVVGLIVSYFGSIIVFTSFWAMLYKKDKDIMLKKRLEAEKNKLEKKTDDKIVV